MIEFLYSIDVAVFFFINHTIANPVFDILLPFLTDLNKQKFVFVPVIALILWMVIMGDKKSRLTILLLIITIVISDQLSSSVIKHLFDRIRPCRALEGVRMLVDCGSGYSFPSSHAVNNFAGATIISNFFPKQKWYWYLLAFLVALSRPYVGVHYPSDILAGGIIGFVIALCVIQIWNYLDNKFFASRPIAN